MRKSFVALALLVGAATMLTTLAFAQEGSTQDQGAILKIRSSLVTKAARLGTSAATDTLWVGHTTAATHSHPWNVGVGPNRPGAGGSYNGTWDFDTFDNGAASDSAQGWVPMNSPNPRTSGTISDDLRSWNCLDWGNRMNAAERQGRTPGIISAWHADNGAYPAYVAPICPTCPPNSWTPLAGAKSAWCGLRAGDDFSVVDAIAYGGTGNHINGNALIGRFGTNLNSQGGKQTQKNFPGYANQWDQMMYRDIRVASSTPVTVSFLYETQMDTRADVAPATTSGWFDKDPLSLQQGGFGVAANNFISASAAGAANAPVDSFMVYVGVPTDPADCRYTDWLSGDPARPIFDLKRRWFSEVIAVDKPYHEILSTFGRDSAFAALPYSATVTAGQIDAMIAAQGGVGGGVIRVVFRVKTNANYADEQNTGGSFNSTNKGAARIDQVAITGATPAFTTSGFETDGEIDNTIEGANSASPGPAVGAGYAFAAWHTTGKSPKIMPHLHPIAGGDIGPGNSYTALAYADLCGVWNSPIRGCNINGIVVSMTDHDLLEAAGGADGTPFKEVRQGFISPTINLVTPAMPGTNDVGLDAQHVATNQPWLLFNDLYTGIYADVYAQGNLYALTLISYPTLQKNGATIWGDLGVISSVSWWGDYYCLQDQNTVSEFINTSNPTGIPDSVKVVFYREQRCISFGATNCSSTDGHYVDNIALGFPPPTTGSSDNISIDIWDWYTDAFPRNETVALPGTAGFDTCAANIYSAFQRATASTDGVRSNIASDTMFIKGTNSTGTPARMDAVFRVYPGPGNYVIPGNRSSGLRQVPTSTTPAVSGDASFWGQYMADPGTFSKGVHTGAPSGWNVDTWNSVRVDTVENNIFPAMANNANLPAITAENWASMIYDGSEGGVEPKFATLGILKNRCFLIDPSAGAVVNHTNIDCATVPAWVLLPGTGYDGNQQTREYTSIFPSGLLTPGSSIEYFYRFSKLASPGVIATMNPDTDVVFVQKGGHWNYDGLRWASIFVLPDKWKSIEYGGLGSACMLVVNQQARRGNLRGWAGIADSIGATRAAKYGAGNGWHCQGGYIASDGSGNYTSEKNCGTDPNIAVWPNRGQMGSTWDRYNVTSAESPSGNAAHLGGRLAILASGYQLGKDAKIGPTPEMLSTYYNMLFFLAGDMSGVWLGPNTNQGSQEMLIIDDFLNASGQRGVWIMGNGFVEGHDGASAAHDIFLNTTLGVALRSPSYFALSGSNVLYPDLIPQGTIINSTGVRYSVVNSCTWTNDVLTEQSPVGAVPATMYQNLGACVSCVAGVYTPYNATLHPYTTLVDGWDLANLTNKGGGSSLGRLGYVMDVLVNTFASVCAFTAAPTVDVFQPNETSASYINLLGNVVNNPLSVGMATVNFTLAKNDLVDVRVYDVTGRLVKTLANRQAFKAGPSKLAWDGRNDQGQVVARGVYFTQVKFINSGFVDAKKVTVLK